MQNQQQENVSQKLIGNNPTELFNPINMNYEEIFEKIMLYNNYKENFLYPLEKEGYDKSFIDKVNNELDCLYDKIEYAYHIDCFGEMESGGIGYFITYNIPISSSVSSEAGVMFIIPDDLTIRNMKIKRIINSDFSKKQSYKR